MNLTYRLATPSDAAALSALAQQLFPDACPDFIPADAIERFNRSKLNEEVFAAFLANPQRFVTVVVEGEAGVLWGYSLTDLDPAEADTPVDWVASLASGNKPAYLSKLYVHPDVRGSGVAHQLMERVLETARHHGAPGVFLGTSIVNARSNAFYAKCGFEIVGNRFFDFEPGLECRDYLRAVTFEA